MRLTLICHVHFKDTEKLIQLKSVDKEAKGVIEKNSYLVQ
jgi:hypothetical protein